MPGHRFWMKWMRCWMGSPIVGRIRCPSFPCGRFLYCMLLHVPDQSNSPGDRFWTGWCGYAKRQEFQTAALDVQLLLTRQLAATIDDEGIDATLLLCFLEASHPSPRGRPAYCGHPRSSTGSWMQSRIAWCSHCPSERYAECRERHLRSCSSGSLVRRLGSSMPWRIRLQ